MKRSMTFPIRFWAVTLMALLIVQFSSEALADRCKYEKEIDTTLDLSASDLLVVTAMAGDLEVSGVSDSGVAVIRGRVCASKQDWLDEADILTKPGRRAEITVDLPNSDGGWNVMGSSYVWMDVDIRIPQDLPLEVRDSSGEIELRNIAALELQDSSGDIEIENARSSVSIKDTSGDIEIEGMDGDLIIVSDSSGDIDGTDINGAVLVKRDSSGDIYFTDVSDDVVIERDSSGSISVRDIGGDFRVLKDGSGGISSQNVEGEVDIPRKG